MKLLKLHAQKIIFVAFFASVVSATVSMFLLFSTKAYKGQAGGASVLLEKARNHEQLEPDKTTFNILLLGYGGAGHSGGGLSDALILANINAKTKKVNLVAIPRDTWVELPVRSDLKEFHKINMAFAIGNSDANYPLKPTEYKGEHGGGTMAKYAVEIITGQKVDYYAAVDFGSFERAIDALGGVEVEIPVTFDDYFYPIAGLENELCGLSPEKITEVHQLYSGFELEKQFACRYEHLHFDKGKKVMDGQTALKFIRTRHSDQHGGDFARGVRQQAVLTAVRNKLLSLDALNKIDEFFAEFSGLVKSDIAEEDAIEILSHTGDPRGYETVNINIDTNNYLQDATSPDGQYILTPKAGNWQDIHDYLANALK